MSKKKNLNLTTRSETLNKSGSNILREQAEQAEQALAQAQALTQARTQALSLAVAKNQEEGQAQARALALAQAQAQAEAQKQAKTHAIANALSRAQAQAEAQAQAIAKAQAHQAALQKAREEARKKTEQDAAARAQRQAAIEAEKQAQEAAKKLAFEQKQAEAQALAQKQLEVHEKKQAEIQAKKKAQALAQKQEEAETHAKLKAQQAQVEANAKVQIQLRKQITTPVNAASTEIMSIAIFTTFFIENIAQALAAVLKECGLECNVYIRNLTNADIEWCQSNHKHYLFICCPQTLLQSPNKAVYPSGLNSLPANKYYLYQLEQLDAGYMKNMNSHIKKLIQNAKHTFDYSEINLPHYPAELRDKVSILPPPVVPPIPTTNTSKKYDVLFCGQLTSRREKILKEIRAAGYVVLHATNVFGATLTKLIQEARIFLNIHNGESNTLETCRLNEAVMSPDTHIISEKSRDPASSLYASRVNFVETDAIVKTIKYILENEKIIEPFSINITAHTKQVLNKTLRSSVLLYILCYNLTTYNLAIAYYSKYLWARPLLLKNQDYTFENVCWIQLRDLEEEWIYYDMVGTLSYKAFKKINIHNINNIIEKKLYKSSKYYHFFKQKYDVLDDNSMANLSHPNFKTIWLDLLQQFNFNSTYEAFCNYFMCAPYLMKKFIKWYLDSLLPYIITHPVSFMNSEYYSNNMLSESELMNLCGKPYYPMITFVIERFNTCFFENYITNERTVFLIGHENTLTGAPILLNNINTYLKRKNINTELLYLPDLIHLDVADYISKKSKNPIVICNTLVTYPIVKQLCNENIPIYWYIHEWLHEADVRHYSFIYDDKDIFSNKNVNLLFGCKYIIENYNLYIKHIHSAKVLYYGYNTDVIKEKRNQIITLPKNKNDILISIIGTICHRKNQQSFLDNVYYRLHNNFKNVKLMLVGSEFDKLIINNAYQDSIKMIGEVTNSIPYINMSDIIVSYSLAECFPLNVIESMYCDKPIVTSAVGGIAEMIHDGINGYLFDSNDAETCYLKLAGLIENSTLRNSIGRQAKETFIKMFDENITFDPLLKLIEN